MRLMHFKIGQHYFLKHVHDRTQAQQWYKYAVVSDSILAVLLIIT